MLQNRLEELHIGAEHAGIYTGTDLDRFRDVVDKALTKITSRSGTELTPAGERLIRVWLATAVFRKAHEGERDSLRLEQAAIAAVSDAISYVEKFPDRVAS